MKYDIFESPLGKLTVSTDGAAITGLHIEGDTYFKAVPIDWERDSQQPLLTQTASQLKQYFAGQRKAFELPLNPSGTAFQEAVWTALTQIPYGSTATYSEIAAKIDRPSAVRAVGSAISRNPLCLLIPCHRVIASDGSLGGFVAGLECKRRLLEIERLTLRS